MPNKNPPTKRCLSTSLLPLSVTLFLLFGTLFLWKALDQRERNQFKKANQAQTQHIKHIALDHIDDWVTSLTKMGKRRHVIPDTVWEEDARSYLDMQSGLRKIMWIDAEERKEKGEYTQDIIDLSLETQSILSERTQKGFVLYLPIFKSEQIRGSLAATFNAENLLNALLPKEFLAHYSISVHVEGEKIYSRNQVGSIDRHFETSDLLYFYGNQWQITIWPRTGLLLEHRSFLPLVTLMFGISLSSALFFAVYFAQATYLRSEALKTNAKRLYTANQRAQHLLQELEKASRAKITFFANLTHEIRNPLNGIIGMTSLLRKTDLNEKQKRFIDRIDLSGDLLKKLTCDILDFSKMEADELSLESIPISVEKHIEETVALIEPKALQKNLFLAYRIDANCPKIFWGDPTRIRQVLTNLIANALKFTKSGSINIHVKKQGNFLHFEVIDCGMGIEKNVIEQIFKKFTQANGSIARKFGGTGLGLSIAKQLVELMGGGIGCKSTLGEGSTFWFTLPLLPSHPETKTNPQNLHVGKTTP